MNGKRDRGDLIWDDLRIFLAVARAGTLSGAASLMHLGLATVSRRIERLESAMARPLFLRHQSGYRLTEDGRALLDRAEEIESAARSLTADTRKEPEISGPVRLATAENFATALIVSELPALRARYPRLSLDLVTDIAAVNLHRRDADLALRMVKPERGHLTVQRLGTLGYGLYASQSYLAQREPSRAAPDPDIDAFIAWGELQTHLPAAKWIERHLQGRAPALTASSLAVQLSACEAGLGLAILPHFLARPRGLVRLDADPGMDQAIWLVVQSDLLQSRRVRVVADFCRDLVRRRQADLSGAQAAKSMRFAGHADDDA